MPDLSNRSPIVVWSVVLMVLLGVGVIALAYVLAGARGALFMGFAVVVAGFFGALAVFANFWAKKAPPSPRRFPKP
jgi:hypothetical protein